MAFTILASVLHFNFDFQVEKALCACMHPLLSAWLLSCNLIDVCSLLPILAVYIAHYVTMDTFHKALVDR